MDANYMERIFELQKRNLRDEEKKWYFYSHLELLDWIAWELEEVKQEIKQNNSVYLEDELADVFWCYMRLLTSLEREKYISIEKVFERGEQKYRERTKAIENNISWDEIKIKQKKERKQEHNEFYNT